MFLPLSFRLIFESEISSLVPSELKVANLQDLFCECLKERHRKKSETISSFLDKVANIENPREYLQSAFPQLNPLVDTKSLQKIKQTLNSLLKGEIQKPSLLRAFGQNFTAVDESLDSIAEFYPNCIRLLSAKTLDPLSSAVMLERTISQIPTCLDDFFRNNFPLFEPVFQLTTDEILPIVIWIILEYLISPTKQEQDSAIDFSKKVSSLVTSLYSCSLFLTDKQRTGQIGYSISTLTAAIEYIESEAEFFLQK